MTTERAKSLWRGALTIVAVLAIYQAVARSGHFAPALMPPLGAVARTLWDSLLDGTMVEHSAFTLYRVLCGFGLAVFIGLVAVLNVFVPPLEKVGQAHTVSMSPADAPSTHGRELHTADFTRYGPCQQRSHQVVPIGSLRPQNEQTIFVRMSSSSCCSA